MVGLQLFDKLRKINDHERWECIARGEKEMNGRPKMEMTNYTVLERNVEKMSEE